MRTFLLGWHPSLSCRGFAPGVLNPGPLKRVRLWELVPVGVRSVLGLLLFGVFPWFVVRGRRILPVWRAGVFALPFAVRGCACRRRRAPPFVQAPSASGREERDVAYGVHVTAAVPAWMLKGSCSCWPHCFFWVDDHISSWWLWFPTVVLVLWAPSVVSWPSNRLVSASLPSAAVTFQLTSAYYFSDAHLQSGCASG